MQDLKVVLHCGIIAFTKGPEFFIMKIKYDESYIFERMFKFKFVCHIITVCLPYKLLFALEKFLSISSFYVAVNILVASVKHCDEYQKLCSCLR